MNEMFFGYGSGESFYDKRRHINVIFQLLMMYKLKAIPSIVIPQFQQASRMPVQEAAELVCNDILTYSEHNYLNLLRERYCLNDTDFTKIMSGYGCTFQVNKTPAGYNKRQNQELLVQMLNSRYYMRPQDANAFAYINSAIIVWASGMRGIVMNQETFIRYDQLWRKALALYPTNFQLKEIENYIIANV